MCAPKFMKCIDPNQMCIYLAAWSYASSHRNVPFTAEDVSPEVEFLSSNRDKRDSRHVCVFTTTDGSYQHNRNTYWKCPHHEECNNGCKLNNSSISSILDDLSEGENAPLEKANNNEYYFRNYKEA